MKLRFEGIRSKMKSYLFVILVSLTITTILCNFTEDFSENLIRTIHRKTVGGRGGKKNIR